MENCRLVPNPANDGDSFHIQSNGKEYLARLYFVDAPETQGGIAAGRLIEQAAYFGISVPQVVEVGNNAKLFVEAKLSEPFTFVTRQASGLGHSTVERFYGFVQTKEGDLGELLVAKVNTEEQPEIASAMNIRSIPTFVVFAAGREQDRMSGAMAAPDLRAFARRAVANRTAAS